MLWPNHILIKISSWRESQNTLSLPWIQDVNWTYVCIYKSFNVFWTSSERLTYALCPGSFKSSPPKVLCEKVVLRNFAKFRRKHLCHILFFNKVAGLRSTNLLKMRQRHRCITVDFFGISKNIFFHRTPLVAASRV